MEEIEKLAKTDISTIVDEKDRHYPFDSVKQEVSNLIESAKEYLKFEEFRNELPAPITERIISEVKNINSDFDQIMSNRSNSEWLAQNYKQYQDLIKQRYAAVYDDFIRRIREYKNSVAATTLEAGKIIEELRRRKSEAETLTSTQKEATAETGTVELAKYFEALAAGSHAVGWRTWPLVRMLEGGYSGRANSWLLAVMATSLITAIFAYSQLKPIVVIGNPTLETVLVKALLLAIPAYVIRFEIRNYNAYRHLSTLNKHKAVSLKTLLAFQSRPEINDETKMQITQTAAEICFEPGESGFITAKDGAGHDDIFWNFPKIK